MSSQKFLRYFGLGFTLHGLLFASVGVGIGITTRQFIAPASRAEGVVVAVVRMRSTAADRSSNYFHYPVVQFTAANGEPTEFQSNTGSNPPRHRVGDRVAVLYDPERPQRAQIHSFTSLWVMPLIFGGLGSISILIGSGAAITSFRRSG